MMKASVGDKIVIKSHYVGEHDRDCVIIEVRGEDGTPPYLVQWEDSDHKTLFFPGSDAVAVHYEHMSA
jgi:Domain of unknown function (DUF1918)